MKKVTKIGTLALATVFACVAGGLFAMEQSENDYASQPVAYTAVLQRGASGGEVKEVQRRLKNWGYYKGEIDGIYGSKTVEAVKNFQRKNGLKVDGIAGRATFVALGMNDSVNVLDSQNNAGGNYGGANNLGAGGNVGSGQGGANSGSSGGSGSGSGSGYSGGANYTSSDLYLLAKCIHAEARGESYTGQVAVGAVILNRVDSPSFPNTIAGVIYQSGAFTAVSDGQINLEPNNQAMNAAQDAINGWDPTYGCIYYYNPAVATSSWIFSRETVTTIGKHVFAI